MLFSFVLGLSMIYFELIFKIKHEIQLEVYFKICSNYNEIHITKFTILAIFKSIVNPGIGGTCL